VIQQLGAVFGERDMLLGGHGYVQDPTFVVTGDASLLSAIWRLYPSDDFGPQLVAMPDADYEAFLAANPEPAEFQWHARWWSRFTPPQAPDAGMPPTSARAVCVHVLGILWGPRHGFETSSLWEVQGDDLSLIAQDFTGKRF
jgi:hypothetical protein